GESKMIEQEVLAIFDDPTDDGSRLNDIADDFRRGRDVEELLVLLESKNEELASIGAWILGELAAELYDRKELLEKLVDLMDHHNPLVRFHAFGAFFPFLRKDDVYSEELIAKIQDDPNEGVRARGEAAANRFGLPTRRDLSESG
ncbi:MAG: hypothetical protein AAGF23_23820, partial [Acidobacteriota bacterium]